MLSILINSLLPFALSVLRAYLNTPSTQNDGKVLSVVKDSIQYLANQDTNTVSYGHVASIGSTVSFQNNKEY